MVDSILHMNGLRTASHTSPYVQHPNEKLMINRRMITATGFTSLIGEFREEYERYLTQHPKGKLRYVDAWTAIAFMFMRKYQVDWATVEASLGGRFDVTNVVNADISVITNIDLDHTDKLGDTLESIAWHKAGIMKPGKTAVIGETRPILLSVMADEAYRKDADMLIFGRDYSVSDVRPYGNGSVATIHTPFGTLENIFIGMMGEYQVWNAATAITATLLAKYQTGFPMTKDAIEKALADVRLQARMETMQQDPLVIIDGAHNPAKMSAAAQAISDNFH